MRSVDLHDLDPDDLEGEYEARGCRAIPDAVFVDAVAEVLSVPRHGPPDSFVLHAPLELLARAALLPHVSPEPRRAARRQILSIAARFEAADAPEAPRPADPEVEHRPLESLRRAIREGDLEGAAASGRLLGCRLDPGLLASAVSDDIAASLAAAAHGPIFLHHLPRAAPRSALAGAMFGTMARELARHPEWRLRWMDETPPTGGARTLAEALLRVPAQGPPESTFIEPLMRTVDESGLAAAVVGDAMGPNTGLAGATASILRVAAASMLLDDPDHAPYGWSHCLTIPQGLLSAARRSEDPLRLVAIAATHVVGFRAGEGSAPLHELGSTGGGVDDSGLVRGLEAPTPVELQSAIDHAAAHEDAHLTKYVVSCVDATRVDPEGSMQYLAAAIHLSRWWRSLRP